MRICGFAGEGLRNERRIYETFPVKELQDYWSSRPKYEDVNPKSKEFRSGSLLSNKSDDIGGEDSGGGGQTYQEWLALQKDEKEEVPPPPYTLEGDESIPTQTATSSDLRSSTAVVPAANIQPPASSNHAVARPAVNTNTYPTSHASSSHAVLSSSIPAASPPAVNVNTYPTSHASSSHVVPSLSIPATSPPAVNVNTYPTSFAASASHAVPSSNISAVSPPAVNINTYPAPTSRQEAYSQVGAQSSQASYPPTQGHSPGGVYHSQSAPPSQRHSPQPYPPGVSQQPQSHLPPTHSHSPHAASGQPVQSYPPHTGPQHHHQPYQAQAFQPYPPTSSQAPVWGQQPQPYPHSGGPSYQGYPTSTGNAQGYPSAGASSQGYTSPDAQSYPTGASGGPVHQGYPPSNHNTLQIHNPSQDSVAALANEFGRQSISNPSGVSSGGRLPTPPPLHPSRPTRLSSVKSNSSIRVSSGGKLPAPPPLHPAHPSYPTRPPPSSIKTSSPSNLPNRPLSQTGHHHHATSTATTSTNRPRWPPANWESDTPPVQQFSGGRRPSAHGHIGATLTRPQTVGASSSNFAEASAHTHGHSDDNANPYSFPTGPAKYEQYVTFPSGPLYNSSYMSSSYPDQQGGMAYGSWPEPGRVSPPPPTFPVSSMAFGVPGPSYGSGVESQYPGGPTFPSTTSPGSAGGGELLHFPEGPGGSYLDASSSSSSSSSYPAPWTSTNSGQQHSRK